MTITITEKRVIKNPVTIYVIIFSTLKSEAGIGLIHFL